MEMEESNQNAIISGSWAQLNANGIPPPPRGGHTSSFFENKLFIFGGSAYNKHIGASSTKETSLTLVQDDLHVFDITNNNWAKLQTKGQPPAPRYAHTASIVGKKLIIFGGFNGVRYLDDIVVLDIGNSSSLAVPYSFF
jgi:N-acetylneuraminic acid mutarotase